MPIVILIAIIVLAGAGVLAGTYCYNRIISTVSGKEAPKNPEEAGGGEVNYDTSFFDAASEAGNYEDVYMQSDDGLLLHGIVIEECNLTTGVPSQYQSGKWAVLCHGYSGRGAFMSSFAELFAALGFSILSVDLRGHGESEGTYRGMGWQDSFDVKEWCEYLKTHYTVTDIAIFGISMGGATVMNAAGHDLPEEVKVVIEDCGFSSIKDEIKYNLNFKYKLPGFPIINLFSGVTKARAGYSIRKDGNAVAQLKKTKLPVLFIHGEADTYVPYEMLDRVYNAAAGPKDKFTVPGAGHGKCLTLDPEGYRDAVFSFLYRYINI